LKNPNDETRMTNKARMTKSKEEVHMSKHGHRRVVREVRQARKEFVKGLCAVTTPEELIVMSTRRSVSHLIPKNGDQRAPAK
jgi:hypothetical protein